MAKKTVYAIKSKRTGNYLNNLTPGASHEETFGSPEYVSLSVSPWDGCYHYYSKQLAGDVAARLDGEVVEVAA